MIWLHDVSKYLSTQIGIKEDYIFRILITVIVIILIKAIKKLCFHSAKFIKNNKKTYIYAQNIKVVVNVIEGLLIIFIWDDYIKSFITLISFISAAITVALKDLVFNFFAGIYIKVKKIFKIEDRIEINGFKGDVVNINAMNFEALEVNEKEENGQSTGIIVTFPNSIVFTYPLKNYNKAFKYIWNEITVRVPLDSDLTKTKNEIYRIINNIDIIKAIPLKLKNQINQVSSEYRIYYNQFKPIIYTKIVDQHIRLSVRYLMHPKKSRVVEDYIWLKVIEQFKNNKIDFC